MNQRISPQRYGFAALPGGRGQIYCTHCLKVLASARLTDMRKHNGSSYCAFRIATGISTADKERLGI
ncbi:MAG: hypothetical protein ROO76_23860 [Terriglobia bacterium]|nr:hypothetical protein [Terriglobia bacterium]